MPHPTRLLFVHALSPLHAGTGQAVGAVDLPIAREKSTGFPYVPGSSIKGVLREAMRNASTEANRSDVTHLFGPERDNASDHAGALLVGDANLLLLPVRSLFGTFAWVTSPWLLRRFARDVREATGENITVPSIETPQRALVANDSMIVHGATGRVIFEDLDFERQVSNEVTDLANWLGPKLFDETMPDSARWRELLRKKLCILHDDAMTFFSEHGMDIVTRIAIDPERKTVKDGALWTEESLPTETVLVSLVGVQPNGKIADGNSALEKLRPLLTRSLQLGGDATTGRGRCRLVLSGGAR